MSKTVHAKVWKMAVITLEVPFAVQVVAPVEMPTRIYNVSFQDLIMRVAPFKNEKQVLYELLADRVLYDYNRLVEDSPIMDMFTDPVKYERCSNIEWTIIDPLNFSEKLPKWVL